MFGPPRVPAVPAVPAVHAADVPADVPVLDVREPEEWEAGHIEGAVHIPLHELPARLAEVPGDDPLLVVCKVGGRSAQAVAWLNSQGRDTVNLAGGLYAWADAGRPLVAEGPHPPYVG